MADVLRFLTYADGYGQFALGRERFLETRRADMPRSAAAIARAAPCNAPTASMWRNALIRAQELFAC